MLLTEDNRQLTFLSDDFHRDERFVLGRKGRDYTYIGEKASLLLRRLAPELDIIVESKWEHRARALVRCGGIVTGLLTRRSLPRLIVYVRASRGLAPTLLHLIRDGVWSATAPDYATIKQHLSSPCDECEGNKEDKAYFGRIMYISRDLIRKLPANSLALPTVPTNPRLEQRLVKKAIVEAAELAQQLAFTEPELDAVGRTTMGTVRSEKACEAIGIARLEVRTVGQPATGWRRNIHLWMRLQREVEWRVEGDRDAMRRAMGPLIDEVKTAAPKEEGGGAGERAIFEGAKW